MENRRRHQRYQVDGTEISGQMISADYLKVLDISTGGAAIEADRRLNIGNEYILKIKFDSKETAMRVSVIWSCLIRCRKDEKGNVTPIYRAGLQFNTVSPKRIDEIINFMSLRQETEGKEGGDNFIFDLTYLDLKENEKENIEGFINSIYG